MLITLFRSDYSSSVDFCSITTEPSVQHLFDEEAGDIQIQWLDRTMPLGDEASPQHSNEAQLYCRLKPVIHNRVRNHVGYSCSVNGASSGSR